MERKRRGQGKKKGANSFKKKEPLKIQGSGKDRKQQLIKSNGFKKFKKKKKH